MLVIKWGTRWVMLYDVSKGLFVKCITSFDYCVTAITSKIVAT